MELYRKKHPSLLNATLIKKHPAKIIALISNWVSFSSALPLKKRTQKDLGVIFHVTSFYNILPYWQPSNTCAEKGTPHNLYSPFDELLE